MSGRLDLGVDFERYREPACRRFVKSASMKGYHVRHDLHDRAQDLYSDFWLTWLKHPHRELVGPAVPYIAGAMMNMLRTHDHRGRSIRASQIVLGDSQLLLEFASSEAGRKRTDVLTVDIPTVYDVVFQMSCRSR
ncbi:MAG TPA: hypothetical protein VHT29_04500 [Solirubrobacteraceae bacterium]|nr:hypothetical protein [Solirubrobacteraceae bacterium]